MFINLSSSSDAVKKRAARILFEASRSVTDTSWNTLESAEAEVTECCNSEYIAVGYIHNGDLAGWIGLRPAYGNTTWELHPIMVGPEYQKRGIGSKLLEEIERIARERDVLNIILGTDDEFGKTSLSGVDLYASNIFYEIENIVNLGGHPFEFYKKKGYTIIGVVPDASGLNRPDIIMGKRL
mgnify:FL=1